jgi:VanZ family protein
MDFERMLKIAAWLSLCAIVFVTVSPIGLRPHDILSVDTDRGLSFMMMALVFVAAYPKRFWLCAILLVCGSGAIELLQYLSPTRHARLEDASVKAVGAAIGVTIGFALIKVRQMSRRFVG